MAPAAWIFGMKDLWYSEYAAISLVNQARHLQFPCPHRRQCVAQGCFDTLVSTKLRHKHQVGFLAFGGSS